VQSVDRVRFFLVHGDVLHISSGLLLILDQRIYSVSTLPHCTADLSTCSATFRRFYRKLSGLPPQQLGTRLLDR